MIDIPYRTVETEVADRSNKSLEQYVQALLARQKALDLLETIHEQINEVWAMMRRLLDYTGAASRASQAVRVARAAQAAQAQTAYRRLEKRREECIAALHQSERRANTALQAILSASAPPPAVKKQSAAPFSRSSRKSSKRSLKPVLNLTSGMTDAFIGN